MPSILFPLIGFGLMIGVTEFIMWRLFRAKVDPLAFAGGTDSETERAHPLNINRLRFFALGHTIGMCAFIFSVLAYAW